LGYEMKLRVGTPPRERLVAFITDPPPSTWPICSSVCLALLCAVAAQPLPQSNRQGPPQKVFGPVSVETPEGTFELRDIRLWEYSSLRPGFIGPRPSGLIENQTGTLWEKLVLMVQVQCPGSAPKSVPIFLYNISASEGRLFNSKFSSDADNSCDADSIEIKFDHGTNVRASERAEAKEEAEEAARHAAEVTEETKRLSSKMVALRVPGANGSWVATENCPDALRIYKTRGKTESVTGNLGSGRTQAYTLGRNVPVLSRADGCAQVRLIEEGRDLYIVGLLVPQSQDERVAAVRFAKAEKDRSDRAAALAKLQADREAQERSRDAAERAKLQAACAAVFKATGNKKVSDLTVVESQQVQACTTLGMYHPI
jgi:hypothetical protein